MPPQLTPNATLSATSTSMVSILRPEQAQGGSSGSVGRRKSKRFSVHASLLKPGVADGDSQPSDLLGSGSEGASIARRPSRRASRFAGLPATAAGTTATTGSDAGADAWDKARAGHKGATALLTRFHRGKIQPQVATSDGSFLFGQEQLVALEEVFKNHPNQELTEPEFVEAFGAIMGERTTEELKLWFMRIDANASGAIDWEEFSSNLLFQHKGVPDNGRNREFVSTTQPDPRKGIGHKGQVSTVVVNERTGTYWTASRDGTVKVWNAQSLRHVLTLDNKRNSCGGSKAGAGKMITDLIFSTSGTQVMVSSIDRTINVYDARFAHVRRYIGRKFRNDTKTDRTEGHIWSSNAPPPGCNARDYIAHLESSMSQHGSFLDQPAGGADDLQQQAETIALLRMEEPATALEVIASPGDRDFIITGLSNGTLSLYAPGRVTGREVLPSLEMPLHSSQITKVKYVPFLDGLLTASWDTTLKLAAYDKNFSVAPAAGAHMKLSDINRGEVVRNFVPAGMDIVRTFDNDGHRQAVCSFDWDQEKKVIAACGPERDVYLWNPFITSPLAKLSGHLKNVVGCVFNTIDQQLITMSQDKCIKVWDMRTQKIFQSFFDEKEKSVDDCPFSALAYDKRLHRVVAASSCVHCWPIRRSLPNFAPDYRGHTDPIVSALVARNFGQVVTIDTGGCVQIWSLHDGSRDFAFTAECYEPQVRGSDHASVTCAVFDTFERRLIVGDNRGSVRVFNYTNSQEIRCIHLPPKDQRIEVGAAAASSGGTTPPRRSSNDVDASQVTKLLHVAKERTQKELLKGTGGAYRVIIAAAQDWMFVYSDGDMSSQKVEAAIRCRHGHVHSLASTPPLNAAGAPALVVGSLDGVLVVYNLFTTAEIAVFSRTNPGSSVRLKPGWDTAAAAGARGQAFLTQLGHTLEDIEHDLGASTDDDDSDWERFQGIMGNSELRGKKGIEDSRWLARKEVLVTISGDTRINFWNPRAPALILSVRGGFRYPSSKKDRYERLLAIEVDNPNNTMACADDTGIVYVYDISQVPRNPKIIRRRQVSFVSHFRAHQGPIVKLQLGTSGGHGVVVTGGTDLHVRVHTTAGELVGCIGQPRLWNLDDRSTWLHPQGVEGVLPAKLTSFEMVEWAVTKEAKHKMGHRRRQELGGAGGPAAAPGAAGNSSSAACQRSVSCPPLDSRRRESHTRRNTPPGRSRRAEPLPPTVQRGRLAPPVVSPNVFADTRPRGPERHHSPVGGLRPIARPKQRRRAPERLCLTPLPDGDDARSAESPGREPATSGSPQDGGQLPPIRPRRTTVADVIVHAMNAHRQSMAEASGRVDVAESEMRRAESALPAATPGRAAPQQPAPSPSPEPSPRRESAGEPAPSQDAHDACAAGEEPPAEQPDAAVEAQQALTPRGDQSTARVAASDAAGGRRAPRPPSIVAKLVSERRDEAKSGCTKASGPKGFHKDTGAEWADRAVSLLPLQAPRGYSVPKPAAKWSATINRIWERKRPPRDKPKLAAAGGS
eukprot:TRINITY_DN8685_c0_g1_i1.p1 TRINITY_DN8685_c0_g1~~TRINITY_DN8685_c0_g1_i1.p1  ORF type:complete len:1509 (+),score=324.09 TRINITY_DN8685_c0_g1_i1:92-4618(+)